MRCQAASGMGCPSTGRGAATWTNLGQALEIVQPTGAEALDFPKVVHGGEGAGGHDPRGEHVADTGKRRDLGAAGGVEIDAAGRGAGGLGVGIPGAPATGARLFGGGEEAIPEAAGVELARSIGDPPMDAGETAGDEIDGEVGAAGNDVGVETLGSSGSGSRLEPGQDPEGAGHEQGYGVRARRFAQTQNALAGQSGEGGRLFVEALRESGVGFQRIRPVEAHDEGIRSGAHGEAVAVVVFGIDESAAFDHLPPRARGVGFAGRRRRGDERDESQEDGEATRHVVSGRKGGWRFPAGQGASAGADGDPRMARPGWTARGGSGDDGEPESWDGMESDAMIRRRLGEGAEVFPSAMTTSGWAIREGLRAGQVLGMALTLAWGVMSARAAAPMDVGELDEAKASALVRLALAGLDREYPNKPGEILTGPSDVMSPRAMHPSFYGCFDWHSSVHGHWLLVRLVRRYPGLPEAGDVRRRLDEHFAAEPLAREAAYFEARANRSFERMYGWAWALCLVAELRTWDEPQARQWARNMEPLERVLVGLMKDYLPRLTYPVRTGVHPDTAFALALGLDYARAVGDRGLADLIEERARAYYLGDRDYPIRYEPSGEDFFSAGLNEADLMRRVLEPRAYRAWLDGFWPGLRRGRMGNWSVPARVSDVTDPKIVHLVGLNLSRAWTLRGVASALPEGGRARREVEASMAAHAEEGMRYVFSGHYEGEHWLGTFAVYHLTGAGLSGR